MFSEITTGIYLVEHRYVEGKNGILFGDRHTLAIDACNYPDEGAAMVQFIRAQGRTPDQLVLTHGHGDHVLGAGAFQQAAIIAHRATPGVMRQHLTRWAFKAGMPTEHMHGHITWLLPVIGEGDSHELEQTLRRLGERPISLLVPGHGRPLIGKAAVRAWLAWLADYLGAVRDFVQRGLERGDEPDALPEAARYADFVGDILPYNRHGMARRHRHVVTKIVKEELQHRPFSRAAGHQHTN